MLGGNGMRMLLVGLDGRFAIGDGTPGPEQMSLYRRFFEGAGQAVGPGMRRIARYQAQLGGGHEMLFIGVDVSGDHGPADIGRPPSLPAGMTAWELAEDRWRAYRAQADGSSEMLLELPIYWLWRTCVGGAWLGDFQAGGDGEYLSSNPLRKATACLTANAYRDFAAQYVGGDEVEIVSYNPAWPDSFAAFAVALAGELGPQLALRIEHIGSTAVPGLPAKPVVDVLVEIPDGDASRQGILSRLIGSQWEYWWYGNHMMFIRRDGPMGRRTHHVHFAPQGSAFCRERIAFRDYLRVNDSTAAAYADLKLKLAVAERQDREAYTIAKGDFVRAITARALAWQGGQ